MNGLIKATHPMYIFFRMKRNDYKQNKKRGASEVGSSTKLPPVNPKQAVPNNFSLNAVSQQEEGLVSILHQYLMKNNYLQTLQAYQRDCCRQLKPNTRTHEDLKKDMLAHFDQGQREPFFMKFTQFVPVSMRTRDPQTMRMQFYLQLYFFIYGLHPFLGKKKSTDAQAKQAFIAYLQGRGASLSKSAQFLQYYALTNLQKPQEHPVFKSLFTREWVGELRKRMAYFLEKLYPGGKVPALSIIYDRFIEGLERQSNGFPTEPDEQFQILEEIEQQANELNPQPVLLQSPNYQSQPRQQIQKQATFKGEVDQIQLLRANIEQLQQQKDNLFQHLQGEKSKSQHWQNIYREFSEAAQNIIMESQTKWFQITQQIYSITDEILSVCKKMQEGVPLAEPDIIEKISLKLGKYERFMKMKIEEIIQGENFDFSVFTPAGEDDSVMLNRVGKGGKLIQLDFAKIHACLNEPEVSGGGETNRAVWEAKILLLQALKWRVHRARSALAKRQAVLSYTTYDLLGLKTDNDNTLTTLLNSQNQYVVLQTVGLIGALTKDYYGRQYLVCQKLYKPIIALFANENGNEQAKEQALYGLQICSTKKLAQELMIRFDMIRIIVKKIEKERETLPQNYLEYLVALLINILLHKEGPKKAEEIKAQIMMTLINLIQCQNMSTRSLIHGSLYPLLCHQAFREKAKEFGLLQNIKFLLQNNKSQEHENQLIYLKQKLQKDIDEPAQEKDDSDDNNDQDEFFSEQYREQIDEYAQININGIKGQELLMKQYVLLGPDSLTQRNLIQDKVSETLKRKDILMDNSFYERQSVNTPLLSNKLRRNISNNNSVYSSKSTNRVLKSEMNSRSQINTSHNLPTPNIPNPPKVFREKLDTVHQNNSEVSIKDYQQKMLPELGLQDTFRKGTQQAVINVSSANELQKPPEPKVYQNTEEYKNIFQTRAKLVRTPPRK